jgi:toxin ParE1/3/4
VEESAQVRWTPEAIDDLELLRDFIAARNPTAASGVLARIFESIARLRDFPALGRPGRVPGTREVVASGTPYFIIYRVEDQIVRIDRILHGAREWPPR